MGVNPARHREQLIRGLDDDGLEELTLRYVKPNYPEAHRTRRGIDGGIDVLSDLELPPARGWQCKTSTNAEADWGECRKSIKAAMADDYPPGHYTFVFNFVLSAGQRNFWRKTLLPELNQTYPQCTTIDYIDDFATRIEGRDDLFDWLVDGAYGVYVRRTLHGMGHPLGADDGEVPRDEADDRTAARDALAAAAEHALHLGRTDPAYSYGVGGREAIGRDRTLRDRMVRFSMSAGQREGLPAFSVTVRNGDAVTELSATPRDGVAVEPPQPWFAPTAEGARARAAARAELAKGRRVVLSGPEVGITGGDVPEQFADWVRPGHRSDSGELGIGLSEPLQLTLTMDPPGLPSVQEQVAMYRVPPEPGADLAYAGAVGAAVLAIDLFPVAPQDPTGPGSRYELRLTVTLAVSGENARTALKGLGFARAFGLVDRLHFGCPGLLPADGYEIKGRLPLGDHEAQIWAVAATLAIALQALTDRDGLERVMPGELAPVDVSRAEKVIRLLEGPVEIAVEQAQFEVALPPQARVDDDPRRWLTLTADFGLLVGQPTGLVVEQRVIGACALEIRDVGAGQLVLVCVSRGDSTAIVARIADAAP